MTRKDAILGYHRIRNLVFTAESLMGPLVQLVLERKRPKTPFDDPEKFREMWTRIDRLFQNDAELFAEGTFPLSLLKPENPIQHLKRLPLLFRDGIEIAKRRKAKKGRDLEQVPESQLTEMPDYYRRNFHFQTDGYFSDASARLYEHQVELLFAGAADAMRRLLLPPLIHHFNHYSPHHSPEDLTFHSNNGSKPLLEKPRILEIAAGVGSASRMIKAVFPESQLTLLDLSGPYLKVARERLGEYTGVNFTEGNAEHLPFKDQTFDAVVSVYLFHELPLAARKAVIDEATRVLRPGGVQIHVDSVQKIEVPDLEDVLEQFPMDFHEPFYRHYIENPMEQLFESTNYEKIPTEVGFLSKVFGAKVL